MVSSASGGRQQPARGDLWGSDVMVTTLARRRATRWRWRNMRWPAFCISPRACTARPSIATRARSPIAPIGRFCCRARPPASSAPAASGSRSAGSAPRSACGSSAPAAARSRARPCRRDSASSAGPGDLDRFLPESDFVVVCCQWTPETTRLFNKDRFAAMKPGSVLVNVARGEIVDEEALADALQRDHLRGAALDVYVGEFERPPMARLWSDPRVLITPHISGGSDQDRHGAIDVFCDNLRAYLDGRPLRNVIDWATGLLTPARHTRQDRRSASNPDPLFTRDSANPSGATLRYAPTGDHGSIRAPVPVGRSWPRDGCHCQCLYRASGPYAPASTCDRLALAVLRNPPQPVQI